MGDRALGDSSNWETSGDSSSNQDIMDSSQTAELSSHQDG